MSDYSPYQKRQAIQKIAETNGLDIFEATAKFDMMLFASPDETVEFCNEFDVKPD